MSLVIPSDDIIPLISVQNSAEGRHFPSKSGAQRQAMDLDANGYGTQSSSNGHGPEPDSDTIKMFVGQVREARLSSLQLQYMLQQTWTRDGKILGMTGAEPGLGKN